MGLGLEYALRNLRAVLGMVLLSGMFMVLLSGMFIVAGCRDLTSRRQCWQWRLSAG